MIVATSKCISQGLFLAESAANPLRGVETTRELKEARRGFTDQASVDAYVIARGGAAGDYIVLDLWTAGVR